MLNKALPPVDTLYQSMVSPLPGVALMVGILLPEQYTLSPPLLGALMAGHAQLGFVTTKLLLQPKFVTVRITL